MKTSNVSDGRFKPKFTPDLQVPIQAKRLNHTRYTIYGRFIMDLRLHTHRVVQSFIPHSAFRIPHSAFFTGLLRCARNHTKRWK